MTRVPLRSGKEIIRALERMGFSVVRQRGSHLRLLHHDGRVVSVPNHPVIGRGLLRKILRDAAVSPEDFLENL